MKKFLFLMIPLVLIKTGLLAGCTANSSFDCPNQSGVNCRSLDQINRMVDTGQIRGRTQMGSIDLTKKNLTDSAAFQSFPSSSTFMKLEPHRHGETIQRIWIAAYEDTDGNYHQDNLMYSIMKDGHWITHPQKTVHLI